MKVILQIQLLSLVFLLSGQTSIALASTIDLVSTATDGTQGNTNSNSAFNAISMDGRYVAFYSNASNLVASDTNSFNDVFIKDLGTGATERITVSWNGSNEDGFSGDSGISMSADGRYVAFNSSITNLIPDDTNNPGNDGLDDIFVRDRQNGVTERVNVSSGGDESDGQSARASISADGRYVAFESFATNLVLNDTNNTGDIFVHDRIDGTTERVSIATNGSEADSFSINPVISADGQIVVFVSRASNLVTNDTNGVDDIFVHNRTTGVTELASVASDGTQANGISGRSPGVSSVSADGRYVVYTSAATNLVSGDTNGVDDIFIRDRMNGTTERIEGISSVTSYPSISADGRYLAFTTSGQVHVHDRVTGITEVASRATGNPPPNNVSLASVISSDGQYVAFYSNATNLVSNDTNGFADVFRATNETFVPNQPPVLGSIGDKTITAGQPLEFTVTATDPDVGDVLTLSATNTPEGATFSATTGLFSWTPDVSDIGSHPDVVFTVVDNGIPVESDSESITITVNSAPTNSVVYANQDSFLRPGAQKRNEGANPLLHQGNKRRSIVAFDLSGIVPSAVINASLVFTVDPTDPAKKWGNGGRLVAVHEVFEAWEEGNGKGFGLASTSSTRGVGSGTTWTCAVDSNITNKKIDCDPIWDGGAFATSSSDEVLHTNNMVGEVAFDVTAGVQTGGSSWLVKKVDEEKNGNVRYYSTENEINSNLAPKLILTF